MKKPKSMDSIITSFTQQEFDEWKHVADQLLKAYEAWSGTKVEIYTNEFMPSKPIVWIYTDQNISSHEIDEGFNFIHGWLYGHQHKSATKDNDGCNICIRGLLSGSKILYENNELMLIDERKEKTRTAIIIKDKGFGNRVGFLRDVPYDAEFTLIEEGKYL